MNAVDVNNKLKDKRRLYLNRYNLYNSFITKSPMREIVNESSEKQIKVYKKDEFLFHENEPAKGIFLILTGKVKIITSENKSSHTILYLVKPGDILGIHALINGHNYTNSAIALVNTEVCFVPDFDFFHLIDNNNKYKMIVMQLLCSRIDLIENQITSRNERSALERFAELLILLCDTYGTNDKQVLRIELSLGELASLSGTSRGYLSKIIGECCQKNIIGIRGKSITILNKKELETLANI